MTSRSFEREVRNVIVGGLVILLFLAGTAAVVLRNTTAWGVAQNERRLVRETRAAAGAFAAVASPEHALADDAGAGRALREGGARSAALYDAAGLRLGIAPYLPGSGEAPDVLSPSDRAQGEPIVRMEDPGPVVLAPLPGDGRILRVAWEDPDVAAVRRNARVVLVAVPAAAAVLVVLVVPFLRRLIAPIDAIAETARGAGDLVPEAAPRRGTRQAEGAQTFAGRSKPCATHDRARAAALRAAPADALAVTAETLVRSHPGALVVDAAGLRRANAGARGARLRPGDVGRPASEGLVDIPILAAAAERARAGTPRLPRRSRSRTARERLHELIAVPISTRGRTSSGRPLRRGPHGAARSSGGSSRRSSPRSGVSAGIAHEFERDRHDLGWARLASKTEDPRQRARHLEAIQAEAEHVARVTGDFLFFAKPERLETAACDLEARRGDRRRAEGLTPAVDVSVAGSFAGRGGRRAREARAREPRQERLRGRAREAGRGTRRAGEGAARAPSAWRSRRRPRRRREHAAKLFVPFYSTKEAGTGLGLALVAKIAALHRGACPWKVAARPRFVLSFPPR